MLTCGKIQINTEKKKSTKDFSGLSFHNTKGNKRDFVFSALTSQFQNVVYAVTAPTQCQNRKTVTQAGYAPSECRGLGLRAATGLISFGGHWKQQELLWGHCHSSTGFSAVERIIPSIDTTLKYPSITHRGWISNPPICILKWMSASNGALCSCAGFVLFWCAVENIACFCLFLYMFYKTYSSWECTSDMWVTFNWSCLPKRKKEACYITATLLTCCMTALLRLLQTADGAVVSCWVHFQELIWKEGAAPKAT